ncbi:MAG: hypothetical protein PHT77_09575 [Bacteroidales bacterium]|nr:hypothetical protein [Bacteroidales bacterium]
MAFASPKMVTQYLYLIDNVIDVNFKNLKCRSQEPVTQDVLDAYGLETLKFGRDYIIPKPFDPRLNEFESYAVAKAACESGVARVPVEDWDAYKKQLKK